MAGIIGEAVKLGRLSGLGDTNAEISRIAHKISEVVEIDVTVPFAEYRKRLIPN